MQTFHNPVAIRLGQGALEQLGEAAGARRCALVTTGGMVRRGVVARIERALGSRLVGSFSAVEANPTVASCTRAREALDSADAEVLIALGGGSSIDTAKAVAAARAHVGFPDWLDRHLRAGEPFAARFEPPPIIAIPTTAGTGSEVTMWGTIWDEQTAGKHSISHPSLYPEVALLDPALTLSVPRDTTVASALDALSHAMEAIWNRAANPVADALAVRAIRGITRDLSRVVEEPEDLRARAGLQSSALLAGLAISSTRTALAHSISYPLTAELGVPHGIACSLTLPQLLVAIHERRPDRSNLILDGLGVGSIEAALSAMGGLFSAVGAGDMMRRHVPEITALRRIRGGFIAEGRAENFLLDVDQAWATEALERAYRALP